MIPLSLAFIFIAGIAFLGFIINSLFEKIKITSVLPLILIGVLVGPVLGLIKVGTGSTISQLTPYISAIAIAFVLFDVGLNIQFRNLSKVILGASRFTFLLQVTTGIVIGFLAHFVLGWTYIQAFIFSFAISGPSSLIVPTMVKNIRVSEDLKTTLLYESVVSDVLQLIVPLTLISIFFTQTPIANLSIGPLIFTELFGAIVLGAVSSLFWLYILNRFSSLSKDYSWMLTVTMVIATYGIAARLGLNSALTIFVFGLLFANIGLQKKEDDKESEGVISKYFSSRQYVEHTKEFQREIVFFVSTFFFVYIGFLFNLFNVSNYEILVAVLISLIIVILRILLSPMLGKIFSRDREVRFTENRMVYFDIPRGLSSAIVATIPLTLGIAIPGLVNLIFLVLLITNIIFTVGIFITYKPIETDEEDKNKEKGKK